MIETVDSTSTYRLDTDRGPQPAQRRGQRLITLTTCSELLHTDDRMIAFGHLLSATPQAAG